MAASTSYNQIPSSSTSPPTPLDVFLSFRGKDTRYTFTDHLYKALQRTGIRAFKDDPDLRSGEVISDSLIQAIQNSKAFIIVLSENYASSSWCLDELVEILSCYKRVKRLVVPVFYNIEPSVARHQLGSFKEAFETHQTRIDIKKVNKWRLALSEIADVSGYHISRDRSQADIIDEVVDRISLEINPKTLYVAKYPVGLDSRVESVTELIKSDPEGVIRIGIHGMGGVGKTTLAKALYNQNYQQFQGSCFLANVREVSGTENGLVGLQHQLIVDVLKCNNLKIGNKDQGIELIRARLCSTKVLLVVDDLDNLKPLEYLEGSFALGSLIVITTRNEDLLDRIKVNAKYEVNQMGKHESRQLFNQHAFREDNVPQIFTELSDKILESAGGLPLALQVFGSTLLDESEDGWRWFIDKLKRAPIDDIEQNLMISFDALKLIDSNLQDIFLDIACFYIGWKKEEVAKILETCYTSVNHKIRILQKRCLITISDEDSSDEDNSDQDKYLGMHDLLREMGRNIARNSSPDEPGKHSRLWVSEDIDTVLKNHKGTEAIQGIISSNYHYYYKNSVSFFAESFKRMSKLKFLYLNNVNLTGSFEQTFEDLRWLRWEVCPLECLPSEFYVEKLVVLELPHSNMRTTWEPPREFKKLKTLNMSGSRKLETTPNFIRLPCLETLNLEDCSSLEEVHVSIGCLASLVHLNLSNCENLKSLPDSICSLRALEVLIVDGCTRLEALPTELGSIESLKMLNASELSVSKLPYSIGRLSNLVNLYFGGNKNLESLPDSICNLRSLEILDISDCEKLEELPDQLGMIASLRKLDVDCTSLNRLPDLSSLKHLMKLDLTNCEALKEIQGLEEVTSLEYLSLSNCRSLERLPNLSNLKRLEGLDLENCEALKEIQGLEEVTSLEYLNLLNCWSMERLPNLSRLKHLMELDLENCEALKEIQGLEEVTSLEYLTLWNCRSLERLPNLSNLKQLENLDLENCEALKEIQGLEEVTSLKYLTTSNCWSRERSPNLSSLKHLKDLDLENCEALKEIQDLEEVTSLEFLNLSNCRSMERLPNLCNLKHLKGLYLYGCEALKEIQGLEEVTSLEYLNLWNCRSMERLPNLSDLKQLRRLDLKNCASLTKVIGLEEVTSLEDLELCNCGNLLSVSGFPPNQEWINAQDCVSLKRLPDLSSLKHLKRLDLENCEALKEIQGLEEVTCLEDLNLSNCRSMERLPNLCNLKHLKRLYLSFCYSLTEIMGLEEVISLNNLEFRCCGNLLSVSELPPNLYWVDAVGCTSLKRLPNLSNLKRLERLGLENCEVLKEIQGLEEVTCLEDLNLSNCRSLERLPNLCNLKHLKWLYLYGCEALKEIQGLEEVTSLEYLNLSNCRSMERLPNLSNLKRLGKLDLTNCVSLKEIQGLEELNSLRFLLMAGCNSSFLACFTLTKRFFEVLSEFGHKVEIFVGRKEFRYWISTLPSEFGIFVRYCLDLGIQLELGSRMSTDLQPNDSHNFLAIILAFEDTTDYADNYEFKYWVKNITNGSIWSDTIFPNPDSSLIVVLPTSFLPIRGGDRFELKSDQIMVCGIYLLYKTENTMMNEYCSTTNNVQDERSNPSKRLKRLEYDNN